jgi:hypothetical protein
VPHIVKTVSTVSSELEREFRERSEKNTNSLLSDAASNGATRKTVETVKEGYGAAHVHLAEAR